MTPNFNKLINAKAEDSESDQLQSIHFKIWQFAFFLLKFALHYLTPVLESNAVKLTK